MKFIASLLFLILVIIGLGFAMHYDPGFVTIGYRHTTIEMTLWFAIGAWIVAWIALVIVWKIIRGLFTMKSRLHHRRELTHAQKAQAIFEKAVIALVEGDYVQASDDFKKSARYQHSALVNYFAGAYAQLGFNDSDAAQALLARALEKYPEQKEVIRCMQVRLYIKAGQYDKAYPILETMDHRSSQHPLWNFWMVRTCVALCRWEQAYAYYGDCIKCNLITTQALQTLYQSIIIGCLTTYASDKLMQFWLSLPREQRTHEAFVWVISERLLDAGEKKEAADIMMQWLKHNESDALWELLGHCDGMADASLLSFALKHLKKQPDNASLLLCVGLLYQSEGDLNQAKVYLQQSLDVAPSSQALYALGTIYKEQGLDAELQQVCLQALALDAS